MNAEKELKIRNRKILKSCINVKLVTERGKIRVFSYNFITIEKKLKFRLSLKKINVLNKYEFMNQMNPKNTFTYKLYLSLEKYD